MLEQLCADLGCAQVEEIVNKGLHEYLDSLQTRMNRVGVGIYETFLAKRVPDPAKQTAKDQAQSETSAQAGRLENPEA
jgi:hypothetical protein